MLRCKNLFFFFLNLSVFLFCFSSPNSPSVLSPTQWSELRREQTGEKFGRRTGSSDASGATTPADLHTIGLGVGRGRWVGSRKWNSHLVFLRRFVSNDGRGEGGGGGATAATSVCLSVETQSRPE